MEIRRGRNNCDRCTGRRTIWTNRKKPRAMKRKSKKIDINEHFTIETAPILPLLYEIKVGGGGGGSSSNSSFNMFVFVLVSFSTWMSLLFWNNAIHFLYTVFILFIYINRTLRVIRAYIFMPNGKCWFNFSSLCLYGVLFGRFFKQLVFMLLSTLNSTHTYICITGENRFVCATQWCRTISFYIKFYYTAY